MLGSLVSAGATLIAGLFGRKKKEKTVTENVVDYKKMVENATAAGFNPLTAIRNGGSAGFSTSTTTAPTASALPQALASAGGILGDALSNQLDPVKQKQRQVDTALADYQLRQLKEGPRAAGTLYAGGRFTGTKVSNSKPTMSGKSKGFIGPPMPEHLKLGVGKEMPMYVYVVDDNGKRHRFPNPDLPDADQFASPTLGVVMSEGYENISKAPSYWDSLTANRKPARKDLRLPSGYRSGQW